MQSSEQIKQYCDKVKEQIRWKMAREVVISEIEDHILDQRNAYMKDGSDETSATEKAILQMGDAEFVGAQLDKCYRPKPQWTMIAATAVLIVIGMLMNLYIDTLPDSLNRFNIFIYLAAAAIFMGCYFLDFSVLGKYPKAFYFSVLSMSWISVLYALFSYNYLNGRLYLIAGRYTISLSYLTLIFPLAYALFIYGMRGKRTVGVIYCGVAYAALAAVLMLIPSTGGLIIFTISAFATLCYAVCKNWFEADKKTAFTIILAPSPAGLSLAAYFVLSSHNTRLSAFFNPEKDIKGFGYHYAYLRGIIKEASLIGQGGMPEIFKDTPYFESEFLLNFIVHRFGIIALLAVVVLAIVLLASAVYKALKEKSILGSFVSLSIILTVAMQMFFAIFDAFGYGMFSSFEFPFVSYGKVSLIINSALMGFALSVFRTGEIFRDRCESAESMNFISFEDGRLILDFNLKKINE